MSCAIYQRSGDVGLGGNNAPISTLHMYGSNTADVASNGAGIADSHLSITSSKGENIYAYMTDGNAAASSWAVPYICCCCASGTPCIICWARPSLCSNKRLTSGVNKDCCTFKM